MNKFQVVVSNGLIDFDAPGYISVYDSFGISHTITISSIEDSLDDYISKKDLAGMSSFMYLLFKYSFLEMEESLIPSGLYKKLNQLYNYFISQDASIKELGLNTLSRYQEKIMQKIELVWLTQNQFSISEEIIAFDEDNLSETVLHYQIHDSNNFKIKQKETNDNFYLYIIGYLLFRGLKNPDLILKEIKYKLEEFAGVKLNTSKAYIKTQETYLKLLQSESKLQIRVQNSIKSVFDLRFNQEEINLTSISKNAADKIYTSLIIHWKKLSKDQFFSMLNIEDSNLSLDQEIEAIFSNLR